MENLNNTSNQEVTSLKIFLGDLDLESFIPTDQYSITEKISEANLILEKDHKGLDLEITYLFNGSLNRIKSDLNNLKTCLNLLFKTLSRHYLCKPKPFINSKINTKTLHSLYPDGIIPTLFTLSFDKSDISLFLQSLLKIEKFENYKTIHLFTHEKGSSSTNQITIDLENIDTESWSVQTFTTLFNAVKKSKNRSFGQSSLKASNFQVIGTCLAHEFILQTHNVVIIMTRNDFIAQTPQEIKNFESINLPLKFFINQYLTQESYNNKINQFEELADQILDNPSQQLNKLEMDKTLRLSFEKLVKKQSKKSNFHSEKLNLLGELLNTLRHELSNPLFGLQLSTELLKTEDLDPDQHEMVNDISTAIQRSQSIIENFSDLYKTNAQTESIDIANLIQEVFTLTKSESRSIKQEISFNSNEPNINITGNKTWLAQVFFNLIINSAQAMKYSRIDTPKITIKIQDTTKNQTEIHFIDNGPGIRETESDIFSPFFTTKTDGTGLGLNICKNLMEKMNGSIRLIKNDKGAYFKLVLPNENTNN